MVGFVQSILFDRSKWDLDSARKWFDTQDRYHAIKVDITDRYLRFRQVDPDYKKYHYRIHRLPSGIAFIMGFPGVD